MTAYSPVRQCAVETARFSEIHGVMPQIEDDPTLSTAQWWTPWHSFVGRDNILAESGRIRVVLRDDQWMIQRYNEDWKSISFHREPGSLLRVLGEKSRAIANWHLAPDFNEVGRQIESIS